MARAASLEALGGLHGGGGPAHCSSAAPRLLTICESTCPLCRLYKELLLIRRGWPHENRNRQDAGMVALAEAVQVACGLRHTRNSMCRQGNAGEKPCRDHIQPPGWRPARPGAGVGRSEALAALLMDGVATGASGHCVAALSVAACTPGDPGVLSREIRSVISNSPKPHPSRIHQRWAGHRLWECAGDSRVAASADTVARDLVGPRRCPAARRGDAEGTPCCHFRI